MDSLHDWSAAAQTSQRRPVIYRRVLSYVLENFQRGITLNDLADAAGMSRYAFCRRFHRDCGVPPMRWLWNFRTNLAAEVIAADPEWPLTDVALACGFTSSAHFSRAFKQTFSETPSTYRKRMRNQHVAAQYQPHPPRRDYSDMGLASLEASISSQQSSPSSTALLQRAAERSIAFA